MSNPPPNPPTHDEELVAADDRVIGRAFRWSMVVVVVAVGVVAMAIWLLRRPESPPPTHATPNAVPETVETSGEPPPVVFTDITTDSGIGFVHENGATGDKLLPETMGGGCAFLDYDNDGDQDLLLVNSNRWPEAAPGAGPAATMALYRNDGAGGFEDVTASSGLAVSFYGMGAAVGDYDGDGDVDVFFTAVGSNRLFRNDGGQFVDVSATAGVAGDPKQWSSSAAFVDVDNDADLDLFVCNYVRWSREIDLAVDYRLVGVGRAYGPPMNFEGTHCTLYRNNGDGTFTDVSAAVGIQVENIATGAPVGKALGVAPVDVDGDGYIDLFVANDTVRNFFFHNQGDGTFVEKATLYGLSFDRNGNATGAMGIDAGHFRNDDNLGFFIGNFANEMTSVYVSQDDRSLFADEAITEGIGGPTRRMLTFGLVLFDYDLDGRLDLLQANGHIEDRINVVQASQHYRQPAQLFWNAGPDARATFVPVERESVGDLAKPIVGRGVAFADIDNDGDLDVLLTQTGGPPLLLRNDQRLGRNALRIRLVGRTVNRDAIGAWIEVTDDLGTQRRQVMPTRSYLSQVELPVTFGLGRASECKVKVLWPGGRSDSLGTFEAGYTYTIDESRGVTGRKPFATQ